MNSASRDRPRLITMSNVLDKKKNDWMVVNNKYNITDDHVDIGSRIVSTRYNIDNIKDLPEDWLTQGNLVEGYVTENSKFFVTGVLTTNK